MSLADKIVVVAGGAGVAGEAVAEGLLQRGATVAVTSRSEARLAPVLRRLRSPRLHGFAGAMDELAPAEEVRDRIIATLGPIDAVVASLGGWWEGEPLTRLDPAVWHRILASNLTSHFIAARCFIPAMIGRQGAVYVTLGGVAASLALPHAAPVSVTGAAQTRLLEVLDAEHTGVRMHEVRIMTPVVTHRWDRTYREPGWVTGEWIGAYVADVIAADVEPLDRLVLHAPELDTGQTGPAAAPRPSLDADDQP